MATSIDILFGFLGSSILAVKGGYQVLPSPPSHRIFRRLADAKWFLALRWCDQLSVPAGILTNVGQISFHNELALQLGANTFIPPAYRPDIFKLCLPLNPLETAIYGIPVTDGIFCRLMEIQGVEIDPRYGKIALVVERIPEVSLILPQIPSATHSSST